MIYRVDRFLDDSFYFIPIYYGLDAYLNDEFFVPQTASRYLLLWPGQTPGLAPGLFIAPVASVAIRGEVPIPVLPSRYLLLGPGAIPGGAPQRTIQGPPLWLPLFAEPSAGVTYFALSGSIADTSVVTVLALNELFKLTGSAADTSAVTASKLNELFKLSGTAADTSAASASKLNELFKLTGSIADTSAASASALNELFKFTGSATDTSAVTASTLNEAFPLSGAVSDSSAVSASDLNEAFPLSGAVADFSSVTGIISAAGPVALSGAIADFSSVSGTLSATVPLSGEADGVSSASATLTVGAGVFIPPYSQGIDVYKLRRKHRRKIERERVAAEAMASLEPPHHVYLMGRVESASSAAASLTQRVAVEGIVASHSAVTAILSYHVNRGVRRHDEEILLFLEAA